MGAVLGLFAPLFFTSVASAEVACGDTTCPKGFICDQVPAPCPAIDCSQGGDCPVCDGTTPMCVPAPCTSQADCGADMVCAGFEQLDCSGSGPALPQPTCAPGAECAKPEPVECTTSTIYECTPRWQLPCQADNDCGAGFTCVEQQSCGCSGGAPSATPGATPRGPNSVDPAPPSSGFAPAEPVPAPLPRETDPSTGVTCDCQPSGVKACELVRSACTSDADCASGWTCEDNREGACSSRPGGGTTCTPADPPRLCMPPYSGVYGGVAVGGEATAGPGVGTPGRTPIGPAAPPAADGSGAQASGGGCSVSGAPANDTTLFAWAALAAGAAVGLRRRGRSRV